MKDTLFFNPQHLTISRLKDQINKFKRIFSFIFIIGICFIAVDFFHKDSSLSLGQDTQQVKIGVIGPFTGDVASYGERVKNAAMLARDEINNAGGINGKNIELIFEDTQCTPKNSVSAVNKLISIDKVPVILGDTCSSATFAAGNVAQKNKVVLFTPISSADNISHIGDYVFRLAPYDGLQAEIVSRWLYDLGHRKIAILHINNDYGVGLMKSFKENFEKLGGTVVKIQSFEDKATSFRVQWQNIKDSNPDAVFAPSYPSEAINLGASEKLIGVWEDI